jgi:peptidyl-tRNA hydrolase, PTH1 family
MKLIVGLGNPGEKYKKTYHNLGFIVLDEFAHFLKKSFKKSSKAKAEIIKCNDFILLKPLSFMNNSGFPVLKIAQFYKIKPNDIWVIHDDADLMLGNLKIKKGGGSAGHKGIESIIKELGTKEFIHFKMGVAKDTKKAEEFVLEKIALKNQDLQEFINKMNNALEVSLKKGIEKAANLFNN